MSEQNNQEDLGEPTTLPEASPGEQEAVQDHDDTTLREASSDPNEDVSLSVESNKRTNPEHSGEHHPEQGEAVQDHDDTTLREASPNPNEDILSEKSKNSPEHSEEPRTSGLPEQGEAAEKTESPKPFASFLSDGDSPLEGAVGGRTSERRNSSSSDGAILEMNKQASALDQQYLHSGKLDVFQRFFDEDGLQFFTRSENRTRHNAGRSIHSSEGCLGERESPNENPLGHLQVTDPPPEPLLNQAGAVVGVKSRGSELPRTNDNNPLFGFDNVEDAEHSLGSAATIPIGEIYSGIYSPFRPSSQISSRGVSPGESFPSFPSRPQSSLDYYPPISPLPGADSPDGAKGVSPGSTDSDNLQAKRDVRRKKRSASRRVPVPARNDSAFAGSEGCYSDEQKNETGRKTSTSPLEIPTSASREISKERSADSTDQVSSLSKETDADPERRITDSEDEAALYPELSHSVESDNCFPMPDLEGISEALQQSSDNLDVDAGLPVSDGEQQTAMSGVEESDSEQDPITVLSCGSEVAEDLEHQPPRKDDSDE